MKSRKVESILELIGSTPLVKIQRMNPAPGVELLVKLEFMNPGGSVKDRIGISMIEAAERSGELVPGKTLLEASSGNTAIGLAMACAVKGYKLAVTMSESASEERKKILRAYGAELILTPGHQATDGAIEEAYRLAREEPDRYVLVDQYNNDANWEAHYRTTGPELVEATDGKLDVVVVTMGTTGTLMGIARYLKEHLPAVRVVGVEPFQGHRIQGLKNMKESYPPGIFKPGEPDEIVHVDDEEAYEAARSLALEEGIFVGMSAGAAMAVAQREAKALERGTVVTLLPDGGERYLSTPLFVSTKAPVPLRFFNTLSRSLTEFRPLREGKVSIYSCGPSLDGPSDLGLCRRMVFADVLRRYLVHRGFDVKHVVNLGDIDDRTVSECLAAGEDLATFTARWEKNYFAEMAMLRVQRAQAHPRASAHVGEMVEQTRALLERGLAYEKLRSVYFSVQQDPEYGRLAGIEPKSMRAGGSTEYDYYEKDNPRDFALFKRSSLAELKAGIYWSTPWGNARPGWHVECATLSTRHLGQPFDIHTASADLVFPHGDNEIAIARGVNGKRLANTWLHSEVVMSDEGKVARSNGSELTLKGLLERGHSPSAIRYWLLATHYRKVLRYDEEQLRQAAEAVHRFNSFVQRVRGAPDGKVCEELDQLLYDTRSGWHERMDNDLNLPRAFATLFSFIRAVNRQIDLGCVAHAQRGAILELLRDVDMTLAIMAPVDQEDDARIEVRVRERDAARRRGDYPRADALRAELEEQGITLRDTPAGTLWIRRTGK